MSLLWTGATAGLLGASGFAWAVRGRASQVFGESVYRGKSGRRSVALTFDDGPSDGTEMLLDILDSHDVKATFFMCGANVERRPAIARRIVNAGHEIGNHTFTHTRLDFKSQEFIYRELASAQDVIRSATGREPVWFRAPYGVRWFGLRDVQAELGLRGAMWTTIARDWKLPASEIARRVLANVTPGAIFCLHDGRGIHPSPDIRETLEAVKQILPALAKQGFELETLTDLMH